MLGALVLCCLLQLAKPLDVASPEDVFERDGIDVHGWWDEGPGWFFTKSLIAGLSEEALNSVRNCKVISKGDYTFAGRISPKPPRVWLTVNGESASGEKVWHQISQSRYAANGRFLIIGNWWNSTTAEFTNGRVTSLWIPTVSLSFAGLRGFTPQELVQKPAPKKKSGAVVYQHRKCHQARERVWDELNKNLKASKLKRGTAIGKCNGFLSLGVRDRKFPPQQSRQGLRDDSVERFQSFHTAVAIENSIETPGYVTEKILIPFLARAVPIYGGPAQAALVFNPASFLDISDVLEKPAEAASRIVDFLGKPSAVNRMRKAAPVDDEGMKQFFSWHPAAWRTHGDFLRRKVMGNLLDLCSRVPGLEQKEALAVATVAGKIRQGESNGIEAERGEGLNPTSESRLFVLILTAWAHFQQRNILRRTWFSLNHGVDTTCEGRKCIFPVSGRFFVAASAGDASPVADNWAGDIVQLSGAISGYQQLYAKLLHALAWVQENVPSDYILKVDEDVFVHASGVLRMIPPGLQNKTYLGAPRVSRPDRNPQSKVFVSARAFPDALWPTFNQGIHYLISADLVSWLVDHKDTLRSPGDAGMEDVSLAIWLAELGVKPQKSKWMFYIHANRWQDSPEPALEVIHGCDCSDDLADRREIVDRISRISESTGPVVLGLDLDSVTELGVLMDRLRISFDEQKCSCNELPPWWLLHEGTRLERLGKSCESSRIFIEAFVRCDADHVPTDVGTKRCPPVLLNSLVPPMQRVSDRCDELTPGTRRKTEF